MGETKIEPATATKIYDLTDADKLPTIDIPGVEIFAEGSWNGDAYSAKDLDDMVAAFGKVGFKPPVKAGHEDGQEDAATAKRLFGDPSLGYVSRIYRQGKKLMADLVGIPRVFANLIRAGSYRRISAEVYWNYKDENGGSIYPRVLRAVSFLGAAIPALTGLKEIEALYKKNAAGFLYANDGAGNEFRLYDRDYNQSVPFGPVSDFLLTARRKTKASVNYSDDAEQCGECKFYIENIHNCTLVEGFIEADDGCDLFEAEAENYSAKQRVKTYTIEKRGDEYCLIAKSTGKVLGCHPTREKAQAQEAAIKANERSEEGTTMKTVKLDRDEVRKVCSSCADSMADRSISALIFKTEEAAERFLYMTAAECVKDEKMVEKYPDAAERKEKCGEMAKGNMEAIEKEIKRLSAEGGSMTPEEIKAAEKKLADERTKFEADKKQFNSDQEAITAKAKKDADEVATKKEKENEKLRGRVAQLEQQGKDEQLGAWIAKQTQDRKLIPVEVPRLTAIFKAVRDMPKIVKFSESGKEVEQTPEDALKAMIETRKPHQLFTEFSRHEGEPETFENAQTEVDSKTKAYMKEKGEKEYKIAMRAVLNADAGLNERYQRMQQ